jgi:hypothetical protein
MKKLLLALPAILILILLSACSLSQPGTPTPLPTPIIIPSPTLFVTSPTPTNTGSAPTPTTGSLASPSAIPTGDSTLPGSPSGPYAVILVAPSDVLNIRSGPGVSNTVIGSFASTTTNIMRTGPSSTADGDLWVQIQDPAGGTGWVNASFLTEYATPAAFCADIRVNNLITSLDGAFTTNNGVQLSALVSPVHGLTVYLWRYGNPITFAASDARWVFDSTFSHSWGKAPGSGLETNGSFHEVVLPDLQDVFNASYSLTCNSLGTAPQYGLAPWPETYANVNYYTVFKPGTPGVDLDWRYWLVGVEYVQDQPYVFALIHFQWEP